MTSVYSVLFYDRLKQKPKHDGKLTVSRTENDHHVILESSEIHPAIVSYDDHGGDLTSDRENKSSMKKKSSHSKKSWDSCPPTGLLFSGKSPEISKKLLFSTALEIDDVITLSKWQCLIISIDSHSKSDFAVEHITKKTITHKTSIAHPLTIKKKLHSSNTDKMLLSSVNNGKEEAILFHGRKRKLIGDEMGSMIDESQLTERPIVIGPRFSSTDISFEIPHSIKSALRPHQVDGVMFLWKAITGSSTSLQNIWEKTPVDASKYSAGAILGDEMGSGKTLMTIALLCGLFRRNRKKVRLFLSYM
jgi:SNF2 family DNA or RNA helicase